MGYEIPTVFIAKKLIFYKVVIPPPSILPQNSSQRPGALFVHPHPESRVRIPVHVHGIRTSHESSCIPLYQGSSTPGQLVQTVSIYLIGVQPKVLEGAQSI